MAITATGKKCIACGETKPLEEFHRNPQARDGRHPRCKPCKNAYAKGRYQNWGPEQRERNRANMVRYRYGVELDLIDMLYEQQEGCCVICSRPGGHPIRGERTFRADTLSIDHDHVTGEFRGLTCRQCNSGLGKFGDSPVTLVKAAAYLLDRGGQ